MIRLQNNITSKRIELCEEKGFPTELFLMMQHKPAESWNIFNDRECLGQAQFWIQERRGYLLTVWKKSASVEEIAYLVNRLISSYHPQSILTWSNDRKTAEAFSENLFYPKGRCLQRIVEPYRYAVKDGCFDEKGYIIHQGLMSQIPFGNYRTSEKGCGWIAAYNLCKACGKEKTMQEVSAALGNSGWFNQHFGQDTYGLRKYLLSQNIPVEKIVLGRISVMHAMKKSSCGILLYHTKNNTSHFAMYQTTGEDRFHFYNAVYGERNMNLSIENFLHKYAQSSWNTMLIYVSSKTKMIKYFL